MYVIQLYVFNTSRPQEEWQTTRGYFSTVEDALVVATQAHSLQYGTEIRVINYETGEMVTQEQIEELAAQEIFGKPEGVQA